MIHPSIPRFALLLVTPVFLAACARDDEFELPQETLEPGVGPLYVRLVDGPADDITAAVTTVEGVDIRPCGGGGWIELDVEPALTVDLLSLQDGEFAQLVQAAEVPTGAYCEVRLVLQNDEATLQLEDGSSVTASIPSGESSGLKIKGDFNIYSQVATRLVLDFPVAESFHPTGSEQWKMQPVIRIQSVNYLSEFHEAHATGTLNPYFSDDDVTVSTITVVPDQPATLQLPDGASIWFPKDSVHRPVTFTATTAVHRSGAFAEGSLVEISPAFNFFEYPEVRMPDYPRVGSSAILADTEHLPTTLVAGQRRALTPHFTEFCVDPLFPDSNPGDWYYSYVRELSCRGIVSGIEVGPDEVVFGPGSDVTRAEFLKLVLEASNGKLSLPINPPKPFIDVPTTHWAVGYISWAKNAGLVTGYDDNTFAPDANIARAEAAALLVRAGLLTNARSAYKSLASSLSWAQSQPRPYVGEFSDLKWASNCGTDSPGGGCWAYDYAHVLKMANIVDGVGNLFHPGQALSRAEAAKIICIATFGAGECERHANLTVSGACDNQLNALGIDWEPWPYATEYEAGKPCTVEDPIQISSQTINGIRYEYPDRSLLRVSCKLAVALHEFAEAARTSSDMYDIVKIEDGGAFNCRVKAGSTALSNHSFANAIDFKAFVMSDGQRYVVNDDWELGVLDPKTAKGEVLSNLFEIMANNHIFHTILTPEFDSNHKNHFHVDLNGGDYYFE